MSIITKKHSSRTASQIKQNLSEISYVATKEATNLKCHYLKSSKKQSIITRIKRTGQITKPLVQTLHNLIFD